MFKIGEFSKIAQVPVSRLRYYDEIGLLKAAKIDPWTGYRYYSARQLPRLNRIVALRDLGLSLDQIGRMLDEDVTPDELRGMFALKKVQAEQAVREEVARLRSIEARLQQIESGEGGTFDIVVKSVPAQRYLSLRKVCPNFDAARATIGAMRRHLPAVVGERNLGLITTIMRSEGFDTSDVELEMGYIVEGDFEGAVTLPGGQEFTLTTLPAVETMVTAVLTGPLDMSVPCRAALAGWMESNAYVFDGEGREVFIVPPLPGRESETVVEIQYPARREDDIALSAGH